MISENDRIPEFDSVYVFCFINIGNASDLLLYKKGQLTQLLEMWDESIVCDMGSSNDMRASWR